MTYQETIDFLYNSLPMYHRIGQAAYKADIDNTVQLMQRLGRPETKFPAIHVAGTNGKGSVSHCLAAILHKAGYKVGLYTSPHLVDFRERIRIDGEMIPREAVTAFVQEHKEYMQGLGLSFFEMTVGLAFDYFARERVDVAVVEVGMGGRLDSTNVLSPLLSIITNIGLDHTQFLGDTPAKIAREKAGIIKQGVPVVVGQTQPDTAPVFLHRAEQMQAPILFADRHYRIEELPASTLGEMHFSVLKEGTLLYDNMVSPLAGWYQRHNLATVMQAAELLPRLGLHLRQEHLRQGIADVVRDTELHGRWEVMQREPLVVCETAHNEDGVRALLHGLDELRPTLRGQLRIVYGCVGDKDFAHIAAMMPTDAVYYITRPSVPRALDEKTLLATLQQLQPAAEREQRLRCHPTCAEALQAALDEAAPSDLILVTGSIFLVADAVAYFREGR